MKLTSRWVWGIAIGLLSVIGTGSLAFGQEIHGRQAIHGRWDIVQVSVQGANVFPGGVAHAMANDGTLITFTGSGTFIAPAGHAGRSSAVTGGGTWEILAPLSPRVEGTYSVTGLVYFEPAPGTLPQGLIDLVADPDEKASAGLIVLRIAYSDGDHGILVVSCRLEEAPDTDAVFEGITATKGVVDFWRSFPIGGSNRTLFHIRE